MYYYQKHLVFLPSKTITSDPSSIGLSFETVFLETRDGQKLHGWYLPHPEATRVMLFFHGNAGNISDRLTTIERFHQLGLHVLIFDYRGYGQSSGVVSEKGTYIDAEAAWQYLTEQKGFQPGQIIAHGRSLGGGVAAWVAEKHKPVALILESTFTSIPNIGVETYPYFPVRWLTRIHYNTLERLKKIHCPSLIIHSSADEVIPFSHAEALYEAANEPKYFLEIQHDHGNGFLFSKNYVPGIQNFLNELPER